VAMLVEEVGSREGAAQPKVNRSDQAFLGILLLWALNHRVYL
jgi:hypothetical protein